MNLSGQSVLQFYFCFHWGVKYHPQQSSCAPWAIWQRPFSWAFNSFFVDVIVMQGKRVQSFPRLIMVYDKCILSTYSNIRKFHCPNLSGSWFHYMWNIWVVCSVFTVYKRCKVSSNWHTFALKIGLKVNCLDSSSQITLEYNMLTEHDFHKV